MDLEIIIQPLIEKIKQSVLPQREKDEGVKLLTEVLENAKQKSRSDDLEKLLPPIYKVEDIIDTFTTRNNGVPSKCFILVNSPVISSKQLQKQYKCLSDLNKLQSSSDGVEVQSKTSSKVDNYGVVQKKSSGNKIRLKKSLSESEDDVVPSKKSSSTVRAPPTISEDIQVFASGNFFKSVEEKDGLGEIEQVGPSEAQPNFSFQQSCLDKKPEAEVKHVATNGDQESSSNQLALSDNKKREEDKTLVTENTISYQDQSDATDETLLALGYQDLDTNLKLCLNYLCLFHKPYKVRFRRLFLLLVAEGLLNQSTEGSTENGQKIENSGSSEAQLGKYLAELENRNMIEVEKWKLNGSPKSIRLLGTVYDALSPRAIKTGFFHIHSKSGRDTSKPPKVIRRFVDYGEISSGSLPNCSSSLRSYISFYRNNFLASEVEKYLKDIIKAGFGLLVILDLEGVDKPALPKHLSKLLNLKYLGLRWTFLERIPDSVGDLPCLQTLDLKHTDISILPVNIWKAKNLQHLYLDDICFEVDASILKAPNTNGSLTNLQTLSGLMIHNKSSVGYLNATVMSGLRKLGVKCYEEFTDEIVRWISQLRKLRSLKLGSIKRSGESSPLKLADFRCLVELSQLYLFGQLPKTFDFGAFPPNLEILTLSVSKLSKDPMEELGRLENLKILRLLARSYTGETMTCRPSSFLRLRVLKLWMLEDLKEWVVEEEAMPELEKVEIRRCMKLNKPSGFERLKTLKKLVLTSMEESFVKEVIESMGSNVTIKERSWNFPSS